MKTPVHLAQAPTEMGITCLRMAMASAGTHVGQEELRHVCGPSRQGVDLAELSSAAEYYGFTAESVDARSLVLDQSQLDIPLPVIALWSGGHAVVISARSGQSWEVIDPISGRKKLTSHELAKGLSGPAIAVTPGPNASRNS